MSLRDVIDNLGRCPQCGHVDPPDVEGCPCPDSRCACFIENNQ